MYRLFPFTLCCMMVLSLMGCMAPTSVEVIPTPIPVKVVLVSTTPDPSSTPIPTATVTRTPFPTYPPASTNPPTIPLTATFARFPTETPDPDGYDFRTDLPSPNGQWVATLKMRRITHYPEAVILTLTNVESQSETIVHQIVQADGDDPIRQAPFPFQWSLDSQTLYYTYNSTYNDGCDPYGPTTLQAYHLPTQSHQTVVDDLAQAITFSPTMEKVAYFPYHNLWRDEGIPTIAIYDLGQNLVTEVPIHEAALFPSNGLDVVGEMLWHPNSQQIVLSVIIEPCVADRQALILLDVTTMEQRILTIGGPRWYSVEAWNEDNNLLIEESGEYWIYNLEMGYWFPTSKPE